MKTIEETFKAEKEILEKVIKQKRKFIGNSKKLYELYNIRPFSYPATDIRLFLTNTGIKSDNSITLIEEMRPLLTYIFSCILHCNEGGQELREMNIILKFPQSTLYFDQYFSIYTNSYTSMESFIEVIKSESEECGFCLSFLAPFRLEITLERTSLMILNEYRNNPSVSEDEDDIKTINDIKTYKTDECVICLENKTNVSFCNCGHICVCEKCIEIEILTKCPVCKTENTILRIIE